MRYLRSIIIFLILRRVFNIVSTHQGGKMGTLLHGVSQIDVISSIRWSIHYWIQGNVKLSTIIHLNPFNQSDCKALCAWPIRALLVILGYLCRCRVVFGSNFRITVFTPQYSTPYVSCKLTPEYCKAPAAFLCMVSRQKPSIVQTE